MDDFMLTVLASNARYNYWDNEANILLSREDRDDVRKHAADFRRNYGGNYPTILKAMMAVDAELIRG